MRGLRLFLGFLLLLPLTSQTRRAMTYDDTDTWRSISGQKISPDGKWAGYGLFPQDADGEVVFAETSGAAELKEPAGLRPPPPPPDPDREGPPLQRTTVIAFTADSRFAAFTTFTPKAEMKKKEADRTKPGIGLADLTARKIVRFDAVKSYQLPSEASTAIAYLKDDKDKTLVLRRFADGAERSFPGVVEYTFSKDGQTLVFATADAVRFLTPTNWEGEPQAILSAKAKYAKFHWDEKQSQLAWLNDSGGLFLWDRKPGAAKAIPLGALKTSTKGNANLAFSRDGARLFFPTAIERPEPAPKEEGERVNFDLWHWKDSNVQTIQKARAAQDRNRTYRAVLHIADGKAMPLADASLGEVVPNDNGQYAVGYDDRAYRSMVEYDTRYADQYLVNTLTGARKLLGKQRNGNYTWSPDGRAAIRFDGKDWIALNVATEKEVNLTEALEPKFFQEEHDSPSRAPSYGPASWTKDGKWVLISDRYDVWQLSPDGRIAKNLTDGIGRRNRIQFRLTRPDSEERQEGIDPAKPLLLRAEAVDTRESGFYVDTVDGSAEPRRLVMEAKNFAAPLRARNADVLLLTAGNFREYPDLLVTSGEFKSFRKISNANPQMAGFYWGTAELMPFHSNEGKALQAAVYKPEGFDRARKYPLMVYIYERLSQNVNTFAEPRPTNSINIPIYVSNGYVVITPDIAYRLGYPGDSAMSCVLPAIQKLIAQGFIDESRIVIQGHSWGGYQIAYMVTRTNMFKAAAPGAVVANMVSAYDGIRYGTGNPRQFQYEHTQSRIGGTPWQYPLRFIENSPIFRADQIETPLLMMHNDGDDAVPYTQGLEMFLAMRRLGKEVYMFNYNGEPHNLRIRANQKHYSARMKEFFDYHVMGAPKPAWMERGRPFLEREPEAPARRGESPVTDQDSGQSPRQPID